MRIYLDNAWTQQLTTRADGRRPTAHDLYAAIVEGAVERVRPMLMTVIALRATG